MAKISLRDRINSKSTDLFDRLYKDYRPELDARITILDLSYEALKVNVYRGNSLSARELAAYNSIYRKLVDVVAIASANRTYHSLDDPKLADYFTSSNTQQFIIYINGGDNNRFIVGKSFGAIRKFVTEKISRNPELRASRFGETTSYKDILNKKGIPSGDVKKETRSKVDIGHIPIESVENLTSPLEKKIESVLEYGIQSGNTRIKAAADRALADLYSIQANISYNFRNTAPEAIATAKRVLGENYIVVTLHTSKKNNEFSSKEKALYDRLVGEVALSLNIVDVPGSNTILQDIEQGIVNIIKVGKSRLKSHNRQSGSTGKKFVKRPKSDSKSLAILIDQISSRITEKTISLNSLQKLINDSLQNVIAAKMGSGGETRILNYRTGRFAASAAVERLSITRDGFITAFYSYQRNPYGTFSEGGRQQYPKSRDPKLLISSSIREIAATRVTNRMRAVVV